MDYAGSFENTKREQEFGIGIDSSYADENCADCYLKLTKDEVDYYKKRFCYGSAVGKFEL